MLITIYDKAGNPKVELSPNDSSTQVTEIQGDSVLTLSFTHYEHIDLDVDDYADFEGERYWLTEKYRPKQKSTKEWSYDIRLYGVESMIKRLLVIKTVDNEEEPVFTLTAPAWEHVAMIVKCMNAGMGNITDWKVGQVDGAENIVIDYFGKYCDQALKEIAEKAGAEWWVEGQTVNICRCEHGEPVSMGYDKGLTGIEPGTADNVKFYTRLYPVGSSRNIDREKYGSTRLRLPGGQKYVEMNADKYGRVDHYEADAFADIYPRRVGVVSSVRSEVRTGEDGKPFTIYYFRDDSLPFDPNDYEIGGMVKRVSFQEGSELAGLGDEEDGTYYFEVNYNSDPREFEIITIWPYDDDTQLPGGTLVPKEGDKYILWNLRMPDEYYTLAEEEFLAAVSKYNAEHNLDLTVYKASTDHVWIEDNNVELAIGCRVRLESEEYFPGTGYRDSRITRISRKVNLPSQMDLEIGDALSRTAMSTMSDSIESVRSYARTMAESISLPDIIRTGDMTRATDNNLLSALRSYCDLMRKDRDDRSPHKIASDQGFESGTFTSGLYAGTGAAIDGQGNAEVQSLRVRTSLEVLELIINRLSARQGDELFTESDTIESFSVRADGTYDLVLKKQHEGYFTAMAEGNVCKGIVNTLAKDFGVNGAQTTAPGKYYTSWFRVNSVNTSANTVNVTLYADNEVPGGKNYPLCELMNFARWGNQTDKTRQSCFYISSSEGRVVHLTGVTRPIIDKGNWGMSLGVTPEWLRTLQVTDSNGTHLMPLNPDHDYLYARGIVVQDLIQVDYQNNPVPTYIYRGQWNSAVTDYRSASMRNGICETSLVTHYGCVWACMKTGTTQEPAWNSTDWAFYQGNPDFTVDFAERELYWRGDSFNATLTLVARLHNRDITSDVQGADVEWTRESYNASGTRRLGSDNAWIPTTDSDNKRLLLTTADLDWDGVEGSISRIMFCCKATINDAQVAVAEMDYEF
jgi:hypothetical protein